MKILYSGLIEPAHPSPPVKTLLCVCPRLKVQLTISRVTRIQLLHQGNFSKWRLMGFLEEFVKVPFPQMRSICVY